MPESRLHLPIQLSTTHSLHPFALNKAIKVDRNQQWSARSRLVFYFSEWIIRRSTIVGRQTLKFHSIWIKNDFFKCPSCRCWCFWGQLNLSSNRFATVSVFAPLSPIILLHDKSKNLCFSGLDSATLMRVSRLHRKSCRVRRQQTAMSI